MKLSFSTNGWELTFKKLVSLLAENRISGIEIHDVNAPCFSEEQPFIKSNIAKTNRLLFENGVAVSCVDATLNIADERIKADAENEILRAISVAKDLNSKFVRLHAYISEDMKKSKAECDAFVKSFVKPLIVKAEKEGIVLLMESMGLYAATEDLKNLLNFFACDNFPPSGIFTICTATQKRVRKLRSKISAST